MNGLSEVGYFLRVTQLVSGLHTGRGHPQAVDGTVLSIYLLPPAAGRGGNPGLAQRPRIICPPCLHSPLQNGLNFSVVLGADVESRQSRSLSSSLQVTEGMAS